VSQDDRGHVTNNKEKTVMYPERRTWLAAAILTTMSLLTASAEEMRRTGTDALSEAREEALRREADAAAALFEAHELVERLSGDDQQTARDAADGKIVNGVLTSEFPTTGALLRGTSDANMSTWCSGTLIGCSTFLTARHCVESKLKPNAPVEKSEYGNFRVFLQHGGIFGVTAVATRKDYKFPHADVAVLTLDRPVDGITPTGLNTSTVIGTGTPGVIVGYGRSGGLRNDYGLKRRGRVTTAACSPGEPSSLLCWNFDVAGAPGQGSNTCNADSGGPLFVDQEGAAMPTQVVAGITSGGTLEDCMLTDHSYDVDVRQYATWITQQTKDKLGANACGTLPQWGTNKIVPLHKSGILDAGNRFHSYPVDVPPNARALRIAMNGQDSEGAIDFDLFVKAGSPASATSADCARVGPSQYAFCEFKDPAAGRWYARVERKKGRGTYQLTSTVFLQ
jgi:hypothetical protein